SDLREVLGGAATDRPWQERLDDGQINARVLLDASQTGALVDSIDERFGRVEGFSLLILTVEAALPRREEPPPPERPEPGEAEVSPPAPASIFGAISREELYEDVQDMTKLSRLYVATVVLSTIVATVGVLRNNVAVLIGAMVIAPLLGPNVGLALATTLGDEPLLRRALRANVVGVSIALGLALLVGLIMQPDAATPELAGRLEAQLSDVVLALAAGSAGALAVTTAVPTALVGVMVAAALLPPSVVVGLMLGSGQWSLAVGPAVLLVTNVICVNLAGVVTFLLQGIRPLSWWEADRARRATRLALIIWIVLLAILSAVILLSRTEEVGGA
ncbi:MAG: TIGR00341 family protein, partial [Planctomycetota bacterium]